MKGYLKEMAKIFKSSSDKALKAGMVILGAGAVLASQAVQQDNASVAHAKSKGGSHASASHASHASHASASHASHASASHASHSSGGSHSSSKSKVDHDPTNSKMNKTIIDGINKAKHSKSGTYVQFSGHGKNRHETTYDRNGHVIITSLHGHKFNNGKTQEEWDALNNGTIISNNNHYGSHAGESLTDSNGHHYTIKKGGTVHTSDGRTWTWDTQSGHVVEVKDNGGTVNTTPTTPTTPTDVGGGNYNWNPAPAPDPTPAPAPAPDPTPHSTPTPVQTKDPAPDKSAQTGTPAPQKPAETPKTGDKKTQNGTQTFNFVDKATNKTVGTSKVDGEVGKDVPVSLKVPNGYKLVAGQKVPTSATIKDKDNPINILVEKDANPERKDGTQTIRFIDKATGKPVSKSTVGGKVGDNIAVDPKVPDGYELVPGQTVPKNVDIKATDTPIDIQVQKKGDDDKNKKPAQQTYQFIDQNGNKVVGTAVVKGNEGDHVPVSLKVPKGYHLVPGQKLPTVADLKATDKPIKILVAKDGTDGNGNADSGINGKNGKPNKGNAGNNNAGNNAGNGNGGNGVASLPQTGNSKSNAGILAGSALVATMASLGIAYNKKKRNA